MLVTEAIDGVVRERGVGPRRCVLRRRGRYLIHFDVGWIIEYEVPTLWHRGLPLTIEGCMVELDVPEVRAHGAKVVLVADHRVLQMTVGCVVHPRGVDSK